MAGRSRCCPIPEYLEILDTHVRAPLEQARQRAQAERTEIETEIDAFNQFAERVTDITPSTSQHRRLAAGPDGGSHSLDQVQNAYRNTVCAVSHLDVRYGESITETIEAEFGPDIAVLLATDDASFTPMFKMRLLSEIEESIATRQKVVNNVGAELESLDHARTQLEKVIDEVDPLRLPLYRETDLITELDSLVKERQDHLRRQSGTDTVTGHELCDYLYEMEPWTYPVLVAVCRFRQAAVQ